MLLGILICILTLTVPIVPGIFLLLRWRFAVKKKNTRGDKPKVGFFHPYCNAGGGGEKVLWVAIQALQKK